MLFFIMIHALLVLLNLCFCHPLQRLLPVLVHVDMELIQEVLRLYVAPVVVQNVLVLVKSPSILLRNLRQPWYT